MAKKKSARGGRRPGAGAPQKHDEPTGLTAQRVPLSLLRDVERHADRAGLTWTEAVIQALKEWCRLRSE